MGGEVKKFILRWLPIVVLCLLPKVYQADENEFSVNLKTPTHQIGNNKSFFNLLLPPDETDELVIDIINNQTNRQSYEVTLNDAGTNINGIVDYTLKEPLFYDEDRVKFTDLVQKKKQVVTIDGLTKKTISLPIIMTDQSFDGEILGGVTIKKQTDKKGNHPMVENVFWYTFAVSIRQSEKPIIPKIDCLDIKTIQVDDRNAIGLTLSNQSPKLINHLTGEFKLLDEKHQVVVKKEQKEMSLAPNSLFTLPILINSKFKKGIYTYELTLKNEERSWFFSKDIYIKGQEARKLNRESVDTDEEWGNDWLLILGSFIIILLLIILIMQKSKKRNNELEV